MAVGEGGCEPRANVFRISQINGLRFGVVLVFHLTGASILILDILT